MDKLCINCKYCKKLSPSVGKCEIGHIKTEIKCSTCDEWEEKNNEHI